MTDSIFVIQGDSGAEPVELREHQYISEDRLQALIANHPDILAGDQLDPGSPRRWLLVEREQGISDRSEMGTEDLPIKAKSLGKTEADNADRALPIHLFSVSNRIGKKST